MQLGFGFGKGRRVIKTIYAGDRLQQALARQREWFRAHAVEEAAPLRMAKADLRVRETPTDRTPTSDVRGGLETPGSPVLTPREKPVSP